MKRFAKNINSKGFSLVEILIALAITAMMMVATIYAAQIAFRNSRDATRLDDAGKLKNGIDTFYTEKGRYPNPSEFKYSNLTWEIGDTIKVKIGAGYSSPGVGTSSALNTTLYCYNTEKGEYTLGFVEEDAQWKNLGTSDKECSAAFPYNKIGV